MLYENAIYLLHIYDLPSQIVDSMEMKCGVHDEFHKVRIISGAKEEHDQKATICAECQGCTKSMPSLKAQLNSIGSKIRLLNSIMHNRGNNM